MRIGQREIKLKNRERVEILKKCGTAWKQIRKTFVNTRYHGQYRVQRFHVE